MLAQYIFFHCFTFNLPTSLLFKQISYRQWVILFNLCYQFLSFNWYIYNFIFSLIIDMLRCKSAFFLLLFIISVFLFLPSYELLQQFVEFYFDSYNMFLSASFYIILVVALGINYICIPALPAFYQFKYGNLTSLHTPLSSFIYNCLKYFLYIHLEP